MDYEKDIAEDTSPEIVIEGFIKVAQTHHAFMMNSQSFLKNYFLPAIERLETIPSYD